MKHQPLCVVLLTVFCSVFSCGLTTTSAHQNPCLLVVAPTIQNDDSAVIDSYILRQAHRERGEEYRAARQVTTGDLTHDGKPETVVLYTIESQRGTNLSIQYLAVFSRRNGKLSALARIEVGGKSVRLVELTPVEANSILLNTLNYGPKDPQCCPSIKGATKYVLSGRTLREQKDRQNDKRQ